jgi:hypothetical protein
MIRVVFMAIRVYIKKPETSQIKKKKLIRHLSLLEIQEQTKPKTNSQGEIMMIRAELNEIQTKKTILRSNEIKSWFFEKIKISKPLAKLRK